MIPTPESESPQVCVGIINSGWIESGHGALPDLSDLRACCISSTVKSLHRAKSTEAPCNFSLSSLIVHFPGEFAVHCSVASIFHNVLGDLVGLDGHLGLVVLFPSESSYTTPSFPT